MLLLYEVFAGVRAALTRRRTRERQRDTSNAGPAGGWSSLSGRRRYSRRRSGKVTDIKTSKTGHITITVVQKNGVRFKTLAKNVVVSGKK